MEEDLESIALFRAMQLVPGSRQKPLFYWLAAVIGAAALACAQTGAMSPYQGESDGVSGGGKWLEFDSTDKMTGANDVRFELRSNNYFKRIRTTSLE